MLARAFKDDPFATWLILQDEKREQRMVAGFEGVLRHNSNGLSDTYTTTERQGGAIWKSPGHWKSGLRESLAILPWFGRAGGWSRLPKLISAFNFVEKKHEQHVPGPHWYLSILGVDTHLQGRGIGGQLLAPVLAQCDRDGLPAYLETSTEIDVKFYQRHGFEIVEELEMPGGGPTVWLMLRPPVGGA